LCMSSIMCSSLMCVLAFPIIALKNSISAACILLSYFLVHVHVSAPYNSIFLKYTFYIVVSHLLCLHSIMYFLLSSRILGSFLFFYLFNSVSCHFSLPCFQGR
jgi:hypothetical protein